MNSDNIIINLKMISKVPEFGRIYKTKNGELQILKKTFFSGFRRYISGKNRMRDITDVINVINNSFEKNFYFLENITEERSRESIKMMLQELSNCIEGLEILKNTTYSNDYNVCCILELAISKINLHTKEIEQKINKKLKNE